MSVDALVVVVLALLVATAVLTAALRNVLSATVVFAAYSFAMAILWVVLQAPDVGLTEAAVGAGVTSSLFLVAILDTARQPELLRTVESIRLRSVLVAVAVFGALGATLPALPAAGDGGAAPFRRVAPFYLEQAVPDFGVANVVTAVLVGYRGFDTFGEVVVVFAAAVAVLVVFRTEVV